MKIFITGVLLITIFFTACSSVNVVDKNFEESKTSENVVNKDIEESKTSENEQTAQKQDLSKNELIKIAKKSLKVPDKSGIRCEVGEKTYWESGGVYYVSVCFYENNQQVACANLNSENGELLSNIGMYSPPVVANTPPVEANTPPVNNQESNNSRQIVSYELTNARAIPKGDGTYRFVQVCPYCGLETPTSSTGMTFKTKCRKSSCVGRTSGYSYRVKPIYN